MLRAHTMKWGRLMFLWIYSIHHLWDENEEGSIDLATLILGLKTQEKMAWIDSILPWVDSILSSLILIYDSSEYRNINSIIYYRFIIRICLQHKQDPHVSCVLSFMILILPFLYNFSLLLNLHIRTHIALEQSW